MNSRNVQYSTVYVAYLQNILIQKKNSYWTNENFFRSNEAN
jgi:hypothetical protein